MARQYGVDFKIAAQLAGSFTKTMSSAQGALSSMSAKLGELERQQAQAGRMAELRTGLADSSRALQQAQQRVTYLAREIERTEKPTKAMRAQLAQAEKAVDKAKAAISAQASELRELGAVSGLAGTSTAELARRQEQLAASAKKAKDAQQALQNVTSAQQANQARRGELRAQLVDAVALTAVMAAPIKMAADWEQSLAELNKVANGTPEEIAAISAQAQALAVSTGVAREGIIGAYTAAAQAGFARDEWAQFAEVSAKMGVAFDTTGEHAGEMLKAWRSGMGLTMDDAISLAAAANHLANNMNATATDIGDVLQRQGAVMAAAGINEVQGAALAAAMLSGGAASEVAATASKNFVLALTKGSAATKAQRAALEALGFDDPVGLAKAMQEAPQQAIMQVLESIRGLAAHEQTAVMTQLFGSESIGGIAPLIGNLDNLKNAFELVGDAANYATSLEDEFAAMGNTTTQQARKAGEGVKAMATALGATLLPAINQTLAALAPLALKAAQFAQENQTLMTVIVGTAAALMAGKIAAIAIGYAYTFVKGAVLAVKAAMLIGRTAWLLYTGAMVAGTAASKTAIVISKAMTAAQWLFNAAMSANPIGLVIVAIGALVAAGVWMYQNWDTVTGFMSAAWERIKQLFISFHPLSLLMQAFAPVFEWIKGLSFYDSGVALLTTLADGIKAAASKAVAAMADVLEKVREYLPFSDAKVGPLSELTASGMAVMHTLGEGMARADIGEITAPLGGIGASLPGQSMDARASSLGGGSGGGNITLNLNLTLPGAGADAYGQAKAGVEAATPALMEQLRSALAQERRLAYD